jgi:hypothetical protein
VQVLAAAAHDQATGSKRVSATLRCVIAATAWSLAAAIGGCSEGHLVLDGSDQAAGGRGGADQGAAGTGQAGGIPGGGHAGGTLGSVLPTTTVLGSAGHAVIVNTPGPADPGSAGQGGAGGCGGYGGLGDTRADPAAEARLLQLADTVKVLQLTTVGRLNPRDPDLSLTVTDPAAARDAFRATIELPVMPPGTYNCPAGPNSVYELRGFDTDPAAGACPVIFATVQPGECQNSTVIGGMDHIERWSENAPGYWQELATDLGVTVDALFGL